MKDFEKTIKFIEENKIITIIRGVEKDRIINTVEAMYNGGIRLAEITFDHSGKYSREYICDMIKSLCDYFKDKMMIGAGTVLSKEDVNGAFIAGAKYIISPDTNEEVIRYTKELGLVSIPGALTPTEVSFAHNCGADFVKVFPVSTFGSGYIKDIKAPLSHIKLLAVGGVNDDNYSEYLKAGACGIGVGSSIVNKEYIMSDDYEKITELAKKFIL